MKHFPSEQTLTISPPEAAEILGIGLTTTYRLLRRGLIPAIRIGSRPNYRIPRRALEHWLDNLEGTNEALLLLSEDLMADRAERKGKVQ